MRMNARSIFLDGKIVKAGPGMIEGLAPGNVGGIGVFETMRADGDAIFALDRHLDRLFRGLKVLRIRSPYSREEWRRNLARILKDNALKSARVRLAVWKERARVRIAIVCQDSPRFINGQYIKGFKAAISGVRRPRSRYSHIKSMDYRIFRLAYQEARRQGYDEAILLNNRGEIVEGSRTNVFFVEKGVLCTPKISCGCLNGITRQIVLESARALGIPCRTDRANARQLATAQEAFLTNSLIGVMPLTGLNGRLIGRGKAGDLTRRIMDAYNTKTHCACPA